MPGPARGPFAEAAPLRPQPADLHEEVQPVAALLRLLGAWPIQRARHGRGYEPLRWCSWKMLVLNALPNVVYCALSICSIAISFHQYKGAKFVDRILKGFHMTLESMILFVPICHWPRKSELAKYFNAWNRFQVRWPRVTGTPLRLQFFWGCGQQLVSAYLVAYSVGTIVLQYFVSDDVAEWKIPLYSAIVVQIGGQGVLWSVLNIHVCNVCRKLRRHFRRELQAGPVATETVQEYGLLWLRARELYLSALSPWEEAMAHWLLSAWGMTLLCLFVCLGALLTGEIRRVVSMMGVVVNDVAIIIIACYFAEKAEQDVRRGLRLELLRYPVHKLSPRCADEFAHLLRQMKNEKPEMVIKGSVTINNGLPVMMLKLTMTYLVVLVQFAITLEMMDRVHP